MMILTAGAYHYTTISYTYDGDGATDAERAELRGLEAPLLADGWQRVCVDNPRKGILIVYRRDAAADVEVSAAFERKRRGGSGRSRG